MEMCVVEERWSFVANNLSKRRVGETVFRNGAGQMIIGSKIVGCYVVGRFQSVDDVFEIFHISDHHRAGCGRC